MSKEPSTALSYFRPLLRLLREGGYDAASLLGPLGLCADDIQQPERRVPVGLSRQLVEDAVRLTGDANLWLTLLRYTDYSSFGGLGLALAAGGSVRSVLARIARYHALVSDVVALRMVEAGDSLIIHIDERSASPPHPQSILFLLATVVGLGRLRLAQGMTLRRMGLRVHDEATLAAAARFFRCEVLPAETYFVEIDARAADVMLENSDPEMAAMLEQTLSHRLAREEEQSLSLKLALWLEQRFPEGEPSLLEAARALHLSERSLQRRLREEDLSWSALIDSTRRALVERHLHVPGMSLTQLAFLLGFADVSSFSRAFKKWYGVPASQYRRQG